MPNNNILKVISASVIFPVKESAANLVSLAGENKVVITLR
jgi:hypothetical protein